MRARRSAAASTSRSAASTCCVKVPTNCTRMRKATKRSSTPLNIGEARNQAYTFALTPLPGRIDFDTQPVPAEVLVDGVSIGTTPSEGSRRRRRRAQGHVPQCALSAAGHDGHHRRQARSSRPFRRRWCRTGARSLSASEPAGATVFVDDQEIGVTPGAFEIVAGVHELRLKHPGFKSWRARLEVVGHAGSDPSGRSSSKRPTGLVTIASKPAGAGVTVNGSYRGETPLEVALTPGTRYDVRITRAGLRNRQTSGAGEARTKSSRYRSNWRR